MKIISGIILGGSLLLASTAFAAPSQSGQIYLLPSWLLEFDTPKPSAHSCLAGQADYQAELLKLAVMAKHKDAAAFTKKSYYNIATFLGYFSDSPVERDAILEKVKGTIDKDFAATAARLKQANYLLFVGDYMAVHSFESSNSAFYVKLPHVGQRSDITSSSYRKEGAYQWALNSFPVTADSAYGCSSFESCFAIYRRDTGEVLSSNITASSKDWESYWQPLLFPAGAKVASRLLTDKDLHPLLAEIFDRKTGKTVLSWAAEGMDVNKLQALVPDTPAADYDFNNCDSLNPDFYHKELSEGNTNGSSDGLKGFFGKLLGQ